MEFAQTVYAKKKMRMAMKNNSKATSLLCLTTVLVVLSFFAIILFDSNHKGHEEQCHEKNCPICLVLQVIHSTELIGQKTAEIPIGLIIPLNISLVIFSALLLVPATLVKQKVKLVI